MVHAECEEHGPRTLPSSRPLITHDKERCIECWMCVRECPSRAMRIIDGTCEIVEQRCTRCGNCVQACPNGANQIRDDIDRVRRLLVSGRPVVALLASEYLAALHPRSAAEIEALLLAAGFSAVETTALGEELVALQYEREHAEADRRHPRLRSTCPVAVAWVRHFFPELATALAPIVPPYIAQARLVRELYPPDTAIVYMSPCWARKEEIEHADVAGDVDVALGFDELGRFLEHAVATPVEVESRSRPRALKEISVTDGFPRSTLAARDLTDNQVAVVRGLDEIDGLLSAIVRGETRPSVVDMLSCDGCIDGPCVAPDVSVFVKRGIDAAARRRQPPTGIDNRTLLAALPAVELARPFDFEAGRDAEPTHAEIDLVLAAGEILSRDDAIDCGACGYETCLEHAHAIWRGISTWEVCFPRQRQRLMQDRERLAEEVLSDTLTGLLNRRAFDRRLTEEVARARRYRTPLSLAILDLDGFKAVNDTHGHACGDSLLRAVGVLLAAELRNTDLAVRLGGDEFALVLPNTGKTDAWAVAEKIREGVARLTVVADADTQVSVSLSAGIASVGERISHVSELVEAADRALYRAKRAGRNRVELTAG